MDYEALVEKAIDKNCPVELVETLLGWADTQRRAAAKRCFETAIGKARSAFPPLIKDISAGERYKYVDMRQIQLAIDEPLAKHGFSYYWLTAVDDGEIQVTCIVSHVDGHERQSSFSAAPDTSGNKMLIQAQGSSMTYCERYSLMAVLGLAAGTDTDAGGAQKTLSTAQVQEMVGIAEAASISIVDFCKAHNMSSLADIEVRHFQRAKTMLLSMGDNKPRGSKV